VLVREKKVVEWRKPRSTMYCCACEGEEGDE